MLTALSRPVLPPGHLPYGSSRAACCSRLSTDCAEDKTVFRAYKEQDSSPQRFQRCYWPSLILPQNSPLKNEADRKGEIFLRARKEILTGSVEHFYHCVSFFEIRIKYNLRTIPDVTGLSRGIITRKWAP